MTLNYYLVCFYITNYYNLYKLIIIIYGKVSTVFFVFIHKIQKVRLKLGLNNHQMILNFLNLKRFNIKLTLY